MTDKELRFWKKVFGRLTEIQGHHAKNIEEKITYAGGGE